MIYLDTSFLAPLFREEAASTKVSDFLSRQETGSLASSQWTAVEFASMVSRGVRMGVMTTDKGRRVMAEFDSAFASSLVVLVPGSNDFDLARQYVTNFATHLRAPDALHLAVAHNNEVEFVATLDEGMLCAAKKLKIPARLAIR